MSRCPACLSEKCGDYCGLTTYEYIELIEHRDDLLYELEQNYLAEKERSQILIEALEKIGSGWSDDHRFLAAEALRKYRGEI